jgi:hypothetical protein
MRGLLDFAVAGASHDSVGTDAATVNHGLPLSGATPLAPGRRAVAFGVAVAVLTLVFFR